MGQSELIIVDKVGQENYPNIKYEITSYGADFTVDGIVKRMLDEDIYIPEFQRGFVWTHVQASRFIESLLLGLPVPGIFLSRDSETQQMIVIDGQQRLKSLQFFYTGRFSNTNRVFALKGVQSQFEGVTYQTLSDESRRKLDNSILHATIVQQDKPEGDNTSIYYLFERINTNGTPLQPQEIRSSVYSGGFNELLKDLNKNSSWRSIVGPENKRLKDRELILRFFALFYWGKEYNKPMRDFLNKYMGKNRNFEIQSSEDLSKLFAQTISVIQKHIGDDAFKPTRALNAAVFDSVMIGVANRLKKGNIENFQAFKNKYNELIGEKKYIKLVTSGTADESNVTERIKRAVDIFADLK